MTKRDAPNVTCPTCGAEPGVDCITPLGYKAKTHAKRIKAAK